MSYNPLNRGYIYVNMAPEAGTSFADRVNRVGLLKDLFTEAGWTITDVNYRLKITSELPEILVPTHIFCDLENLVGDADTLFAVEFSDTGQTGQYVSDSNVSCFPEQEPEEVELIINNFTETWFTLSGSPPSDNGWTAHVSSAGFTNTPATHRRAWTTWIREFISRGDVLANEITYLSTIESPSPSTVVTTTFDIATDAIIEYRPTFGGFLDSEATFFNGRGFIATSANNGHADNNIQIYVYLNHGVANISFRAVFGDGIDLVSSYAAGVHPLTTVETEDAKSSSVRLITPEGWLLPDETLHGFVGPYFYLLENTDRSPSNPRKLFSGCMDIKILESESAVADITRARIHTFRTSIDFKWGEIKLDGTSVISRGGLTLLHNRFYSYNHINFHSPTTILRLEWPGEVAPVFDYWLGFDPYDNANAPLICNVPGTLIPGRYQDLGSRTVAETKDHIPFVFDDHLWRYWESTFTTGTFITTNNPFAFQVKDPRPYDENGFANSIPMYKLESASLFPTSFTPGSTNVLTLQIDLDEQERTDLGGYVLVYTDNERIEVEADYLYYAYFDPGVDICTVDLHENSLDVTETVNIKMFHNGGNSIYVLPVVAT